MKEDLALNRPYIIRDIAYSFKFLIRDRKKLGMALLVFVLIPCISIMAWKYMDPSTKASSHQNDFHFFIWTLAGSICMILTSAVWYLSTARKDFAGRIICLASLYYWTFFLLNKLPLQGLPSLMEEGILFVGMILIFTLLLSYIRKNFIHDRVDYKQEYDGMVYEYHHLCRGFTKTVEGLNYLKDRDYISEEEYNARLSTATERFDEFAMKIHDRYQKIV